MKICRFWLSWAAGTIQLALMSDRGRRVLAWTDDTPATVHVLGMATGPGSTGEWRFARTSGELFVTRLLIGSHVVTLSLIDWFFRLLSSYWCFLFLLCWVENSGLLRIANSHLSIQQPIAICHTKARLFKLNKIIRPIQNKKSVFVVSKCLIEVVV